MRWNFLERLVRGHGWTAGAEIGVKEGRTIGHLLHTCPDLTMIGVDIWQSQPDNEGPETYERGWNHDLYEKMARQRVAPYADRVTLIKAWSDEAAAEVENGSLDFVFIDADHSAQAVRRDILAWRPKLRPKGWLIGHDIDWPTVRGALKGLGIEWNVEEDNVWVATRF